MLQGCPGAGGLKGAQTITVKVCPECGGEIEIFSRDVEMPCPKCGFMAYNDTLTCIAWCKYAKECVGEKVYEQFMGGKTDGEF